MAMAVNAPKTQTPGCKANPEQREPAIYENCGDHMAVSLPIESNPEKAWMKMSLRMKLRETNNSQHESLRVFQSWTLMQFPAQLRPSFCV